VHCELIVPALLPREAHGVAEALAGLRLPALELLLARSRRTAEAALSLEQWLAQAFDANEDDEIPAGALTVAALGGATGDATWLRADPAHLKLNRDQLVLVPAIAFGLQQAESEALAETLNRHFGAQLVFYPLSADRWCVRIEGAEADGLRTKTPMEVAGQDINRHLPAGPVAKRWHSILNEIQMLLHEHPVNEAREARGEPIVNSVWLWGAGRLPKELEAPYQSVTSDDPLAQGYAKTIGIRHRNLPPNADQWLDRLPEDGRQLVVLDTLRLPLALGDYDAWKTRAMELEERWFVPLLAALKSGRIGMVTVRATDASEARSFETTRNDQRHFWRRPKSLAAYL
jgi:hypothetical protein